MSVFAFTGVSGVRGVVRNFIKPRDVFLHDGATMRRLHFSAKAQLSAIAALFTMGLFGVAGAAAMAVSAPTVTKSLSNYAARTGEVAAMEDRVAALQAEVSAIRKDAQSRAAMLANRQAVLASMLSGNADPAKVAALLSIDGKLTAEKSKEILSAYAPINAQQLQMARQLSSVQNVRYNDAVKHVASLGMSASRFEGGMGGPYEPVTTELSTATVQTQVDAPAQADPQFRALFVSWKRVDTMEDAIGGIPSARPIQLDISINSNFGVRSDPFRHTPAMHAGIDLPSPIGTPVYATADGIVGRAGRVGGYGNLIEIEHGRGIQTRFGHLSQILVAPGAKIKRGQLIGRVGTTGRSTGPHLHYEVRIDGRAVNPVPFLQSSQYLLAIQNKSNSTPIAVGGPAKAD
jgi:murein DD-endopeptidase MepM/ murein hydrolase activator NlpD